MSITFHFKIDYNDTDYNDTYLDDDTSPCYMKLLEPTAAVTFSAINIIIFLLAIPGNLLVGWVIGSSRLALTPSDVYLFHLTIADGLMALTIPFKSVELIQGWIFGDFMCKLVSLVFETNFYTSIIFLACISVDRYLVIVCASETLKSRRRMCSWILCAAVWALGVAFSLPSLFNEVSKLHNDSNILTCSESFTLGSATSWRLATRGFRHLFGFLLPLFVMITCYSVTISRLLLTRGFQKHRAMKVIIVVVIAFLLCWTPYHLTMIVDTLMRGSLIPFDCAKRTSVTAAFRVTHSLALFHSCINPLLYAFVGERFRKKMMQLLDRKLRQERSSLSRFSRSTSQTSEASGMVF
ncbi:C-X-C chemokine receptor type 1 [Betta splendens]|uniref:C-X-C chemokine receptor type 1 n=1 Tax=Betta splendens TaxID=158456 RepID=A0A6P7KS89_BETSP|nr:C-X-C chemokine receptor type 1 [Betta splendens]XP_055359402.1 C-X-C chemokine receptor type 1 [Betta splendens]XP_055359403.1 C-X-C chemokine receptor type 1 [Betta splendens]XP_055359405.1 C-X-C chemokine receptor type 1 [Betta splendens]XP_055359408.1 C-X-C chemokine receptor type 1 [Betta splendens]XP_055359410.1 C-X-C chemokine receptor type 1 [Betta splendens]